MTFKNCTVLRLEPKVSIYHSLGKYTVRYLELFCSHSTVRPSDWSSRCVFGGTSASTWSRLASEDKNTDPHWSLHGDAGIQIVAWSCLALDMEKSKDIFGRCRLSFGRPVAIPMWILTLGIAQSEILSPHSVLSWVTWGTFKYYDLTVIPLIESSTLSLASSFPNIACTPFPYPIICPWPVVPYPNLSQLRHLSISGWRWEACLLEAATCLKSLSIIGNIYSDMSVPWSTLPIPWGNLCEITISNVEDWYLVPDNSPESLLLLLRINLSDSPLY